jgi:subtilisin-like proprotein convertase family protein
MRKLTLLSSLLLLGLAFTAASWAGTYKFKSTPHLYFSRAHTVTDQIFVPTNVKMSDIRIGVYVKTVFFSHLRVTLLTPAGNVVLKQDITTITAGSIGSERSWCLFQDGGTAIGSAAQPFDRPIAPAQMLANLSAKMSGGWWSLKVEDFSPLTAITQEGYLEGWSINFNAVTTEPEIPVWGTSRSGAQLVGYLNGSVQVVPNQKNATILCTASGEPNVTPGLNGEAYPFIIQNTGYPGHLVGQTIPGYATGGRFKITVNIATNLAAPSPYAASPTGDIAVYWGKSPTYNPPLQSPPIPGAQGVARPWPTGGAGTTNTLLPNAGVYLLSGLHGGVRLTACGNDDATPWPIPISDVGGYIDCAFDDRALISITQASDCAGSGVCGVYKPELPLNGLNGLALEGLWYLTVYDTYGDNNVPTTGNPMGNIRVLAVEVAYLAGGGEIANPNLHQGVVSPLLGVPAPGAITGAPIGYLPDIVGTIPPYSIHAKDQDPMLLFWATQKMGPRSAVGYERVQAVNPTNYIPPTGVVYDGPYAYPSTLDATPTVAGALVNADVIQVPVDKYKLRLNLVQARYDDDQNDNQAESAELQVTPTTTAYYGQPVFGWNDYQHGTGGYVNPYPLNPNPTSPCGVGAAFTFFKYPYSTITSVDYKLDLGQYNLVTQRSAVRISVWKTANAYTGAPVGPRVAVSPIVQLDAYHLGNWRSFPIQPCDANGNAIANSWSAQLPPGTYVVMLDNVGSQVHLIYPYTYGQLPHLTDRYKNFQFSENFGPIGPYSTTGTRLQYCTANVNNPPATSFGTLGGAETNTWGNFTFPFRVNFTTLNDFAIDYVNFSGSGATEAAVITNAPFNPRVYVTAESSQGGLTKGFNVRLEIYSGSTRIYNSDVAYDTPTYPGINGYQTVSVPMQTWTPPMLGEYLVKCFFSRNPDDQNPANDYVEYYLRVNATRAILITGNNVNTDDLSKAIAVLKDKGMQVEIMSARTADLRTVKGSNVYFMGDMDDAGKNAVVTAMGNGNDVAAIFNSNLKLGTLMRNVDFVFDIDRGSVNYDKIDLRLPAQNAVQAEKPITTPEVQISSKEDIVKLIRSLNSGVEPVTSQVSTSQAPADMPQTMTPAPIRCPYGEIRFSYEEQNGIGITYVNPASRKAGVTAEATAPTGYVLDQNYPNPFNPTTSITYTLPQASQVTLRVLDMLGREVMTLVNGVQQAGVFTTSWKGFDQSGNAVATGTYMYRLEATPLNGGQPFSAIRKMTLAK